MKQSRRPRHTAYVFGAVILVYFGGYFWLRYASVKDLSPAPAGAPNEIYFAVTSSDLVVFMNPSPDPKKVRRIETRIRALRTIYRPLGWIDSRITGDQIDTNTRW